MKDIKLLTCPFCGGKAELSWSENNYGEDRPGIHCQNWRCLAGIKQERLDTEEKVISAWNTRVAQS